MMRKVLPLLKNFYVMSGLFFLLWMMFLDSNDFFSRLSLSQRLQGLEQEKAYYIEQIKLVKKDKEELTKNKELLEKYAREKYLMKRSTEDVFVLAEK